MYWKSAPTLSMYLPESFPYVSLGPRPSTCKLIYCTWNARGDYFSVHTPTLVGSVWFSHYKCSLFRKLNIIEQINGVVLLTAFNLLCMYMKWQTGNGVCSVFSWEAVDALSILTIISMKMYYPDETNV